MSLAEPSKHQSGGAYHTSSLVDPSALPNCPLLDKQKTTESSRGDDGVRSPRPPLIRGRGFDYSPQLRMTGGRNGASGNELVPGRKNPAIRCHSWQCKDLFFADGKRRVDYVLVYEVGDLADDKHAEEDLINGTVGPHDVLTPEEKRASKREHFEKNLEQLGLVLEHVKGKHFDKTYFTLIHAPFNVLLRQAENLAIKMPVLQSDIKERTIFEGILDRFLSRFKFLTFDDETNARLKEPNYFTAPFIAAHLDCYVGHENEESFFDSAERSRMVYDHLIRTRYDPRETEKYRIGIERLINNGSYTAAFPLHEPCEDPVYKVKTCSNREMLYWNWAHIKNFYKYQPLSLIKKYFGTKIGIYFAWLGFYTKCLIPASIVGLICLSYGLLTFSEDVPSNDICGSDGIGAQVIMCPSCDNHCSYTMLNSSCIYSKLSYIFDNSSTVVFAALMSIGATLFLEGWKRYHAEIAWKWGLLDFEVDEETVRPEYQLRVKTLQTKRMNPITQQMEPYMPLRKRLVRFLGSGIMVLFFILLVVAFVFGVIIYRTVLMHVLSESENTKDYASLITFTTAACLNLVVILIMSNVYTSIALKLTDWECPRTQAEFDNSYTFKVYLFQFVNYYSSIFYIAFIKSNMRGVPGREERGFFHPEECEGGICMAELVIQLAIIMCGKQFWNAFMEVALPTCLNKIRSSKFKSGDSAKQKNEKMRSMKRREISAFTDVPRWERDYVLTSPYEQFLFDEYLELVIQFGFVTLFVTAFPLAPLFALINNIIEIRVDAYKFLITSQRPMPARAKDIGIWLPILNRISRFAVLINALMIAFTSDFIPKLVYLYVYKHDGLYGFVNDSLSFFDASTMAAKWGTFGGANVTSCRYRDYRRIPCSLSSSPDCDDEYGFTLQWWIVLAFRLAFVLIFEHTVSLVKQIVAYVIPDMPSRIFIQLQRQRFLSRQARLSDLGSTAASKSGTGEESAQNALPDRYLSGDCNEVAFQPGFFDEEDAAVPPELITIMRRGSYTPQHDSPTKLESLSMRKLSGASFITCNEATSEKNLNLSQH